MSETTAKGPGLARGPALILGAILAGFGLVLFLKAGNTPTGGFPDTDISGEKFLGFETNGWTAFFTTTAGVLLLFGAAQHLLAKTMSLIVGLALAACAVLALVNGHVLGLAAANGWTELGWAIAAAVLLVNVLLPRLGKKDDDDDREVHSTRTVSRPPATTRTTRDTADVRPVSRTDAELPDGGRAARVERTTTGIGTPPETRRDDDPGDSRRPEPRRDVDPRDPRSDDPPGGGSVAR